jgi:hypothetical protein
MLELKVKIPHALALAEEVRFKIMLVFKNKGHDEINDHRTSEREKRQVDKIHPDLGGLYAQFFSPPGTNSESLLLKPGNNTVDHNYKYKKIGQ